MGEISPAEGEADIIIMISVYVLKSLLSRKSYVGATNNLRRRLSEHNAGKMAYSKKYRPWVVIYSENYATLAEARKREKYFKSGAGRRFLKKIFEKDNK